MRGGDDTGTVADISAQMPEKREKGGFVQSLCVIARLSSFIELKSRLRSKRREREREKRERESDDSLSFPSSS